MGIILEHHPACYRRHDSAKKALPVVHAGWLESVRCWFIRSVFFFLLSFIFNLLQYHKYDNSM